MDDSQDYSYDRPEAADEDHNEYVARDERQQQPKNDAKSKTDQGKFPEFAHRYSLQRRTVADDGERRASAHYV